MIPISIVISCAIVALGKRRGYRRRSANNEYNGYNGSDRRCEKSGVCPYYHPIRPVNTESKESQKEEQ